MLIALDDYIFAKNLSSRLIPSRNNNDQTMLQSEWTRGTLVSPNLKW